MELKDCIYKTHAAIVAKAKKEIDAGASAQKAAEIGSDVIDYGKSWTTAVGNDGKISDVEEQNINKTFEEKFGKHIPDVSGVVVGLVWDGVTIFGIGFKGVKYYLNKWFDLDIQ